MFRRRTLPILAVALFHVLFLGGALMAAEVLYFANEPQDMTFVSMPKLANYLNDYYAERGILNPEEVDQFYSIIRSHGAPNAGVGESKVGLVIQDAQYDGNSTGSPRGLIVIKGRFDKAKVLDMMKKNYDEHMTKSGHAPKYSETLQDADEVEVHQFNLPGERPRQLTMLSFDNFCIFHSGNKNNQDLLNETITFLRNGEIKPKASRTDGPMSLHYHVSPSALETELGNKWIDKKYSQYKEGTLRWQNADKPRKGLGGWVKNLVGNQKIKFIKKAFVDLQDFDVEIARSKESNTDSKQVILSSTFDSPKQARNVKRKLHNHLIKAIKSTKSVRDKLNIGSHVRITAHGNVCRVKCNLETEDEQMRYFAFMSTYIARSILKN